MQHTLHQYTNFETDATTTPLAAQASHVHRHHGHTRLLIVVPRSNALLIGLGEVLFNG